MQRLVNKVCVFFFILLISACNGGGGGDGVSPPSVSRSVQVSWAANHETEVNKAGGGYRVYSSRTPGFDIAMANVVDVPYSSGATAPTSTVITLSTGNNFIKVVAYSAMNPGGSPPSAETSIAVP